MKSAKKAVTTSATRTRTVKISRPSRRKAASRQTHGIPAALLGLAVLTLIADPRVDDRVHDVDQQADDDDHRTVHEHGGLHHGEVAERDALVDQPPDARPREHGL